MPAAPRATKVRLIHAVLMLILSSPDRSHARRPTFTGDDVVAAVARRALGPGAPALDPIRGEVFKNQKLIEAHAQEEILRHAGFRELRGFYIDYQSLTCVSAPSLNDSAKILGSCVAKAHAYQVTADVAVNVSAAGIRVQALSTVVD